MLTSLFRGTGIGLATMLPLDIAPYDKVSRDTKTAQDFVNRAPDNETGKDRIYMMFSME